MALKAQFQIPANERLSFATLVKEQLIPLCFLLSYRHMLHYTRIGMFVFFYWDPMMTYNQMCPLKLLALIQ